MAECGGGGGGILVGGNGLANIPGLSRVGVAATAAAFAAAAAAAAAAAGDTGVGMPPVNTRFISSPLH